MGRRRPRVGGGGTGPVRCGAVLGWATGSAGGGGGRRWRSATRGRRGCIHTRTSTCGSCAASSSRPSSRPATRAPTTRAPTSTSAPSASWYSDPPSSGSSSPRRLGSVGGRAERFLFLMPFVCFPPVNFDGACSSTPASTAPSAAPRGFARVSTRTRGCCVLLLFGLWFDLFSCVQSASSR